MDWQAIVLSMKLAFTTSLVLIFLGLPLSYWLATSRSRGRFVVEALVSLPLVLPPTVLGFYLLVLMGPRSPIGFWYHRVIGKGLPFSFQGLLLGSVLYSLPFAVQPFLNGFQAVDRNLVESSWCLGVSRFATFFRLILPLSSPFILTGIVLSFAHTLGEFGVVLMIGGNIPGITRTVSISIYDNVQALNYLAAAKTSGFLLGVSFLVLLVTSFLRPRRTEKWTAKWAPQ